jgi:hypothetical protein
MAPKPRTQVQRNSSQAGADESEEAFNAALGRVARHKPGPDNRASGDKDKRNKAEKGR